MTKGHSGFRIFMQVVEYQCPGVYEHIFKVDARPPSSGKAKGKTGGLGEGEGGGGRGGGGRGGGGGGALDTACPRWEFRYIGIKMPRSKCFAM